MPKFIDYHAKMPNLPQEAVKQIQEQIKTGKADQFGAKPINVFMGKDGSGYCIAEAPNADAICKAHEAKGIKLAKGDVKEITTLV